MNRRGWKWPTIGPLFVCCVLWGAAAQASLYERPKDRPQLPNPMGYVSDHAGVLDDEWKARIRSVCQDLERKTGVEMVGVMVPTIKPFASAN
jgi:uncharacterized protein